MAMIKKETIDQIREQSDIVQVISEFLPLKKSGKYFRTLCPFHSEKSPSFYVNQERQIYHCFGCGAGGSVVTFLMEYEKLPFPEAVKKLASKLNIVIETETTHYEYQSLYDANEFAATFFTNNLEKFKPALDYLKSRKLSQDTIQRFRIGYAPAGNLLFHNAKKHGISEASLVNTGLVIKKANSYHDWFYNRLTFPVFSLSGKIIGFNGRGIDETTMPKYINTIETSIFKKGENLFGLFQAKNYLYQNTPILVEGNFDMLSLVDQGINQVIAPLGTALTPHQAQLIRRYTNQLIIAFDGDSAGKAATLRTIETVLKNGIDPRIILLPDNFDPDKYMRTFGKQKFEFLVQNNLDFIDFILKIKLTTSINDKRQCLNQIINLISLIDEKVTQELYINKISEIFKISKENLLKQIKKTAPNYNYPDKPVKPNEEVKSSLLEEQILSVITAHPQYARIAKKEISSETFGPTRFQEVTQLIYNNLDSENFTSAQLIDLTEKPELKQLIANLSFRAKLIPKENEFTRKLFLFKASWLYKQMQEAEIKGDDILLNKLRVEHYNIKKKLSQMRSKR